MTLGWCRGGDGFETSNRFQNTDTNIIIII